MIERLRTGVNGRLSPVIRNYAARNTASRLEELLHLAIQNWRREGIYNMRLYDHLKRIKHDDALRWALVNVAMDAVSPSPAQLAGHANAKQAKRPDFTFYFGSHEMHVEAKRIDASWHLSNEYASEGLARFIRGQYAHRPHGTMVGYAISGSAKEILDAINKRITTNLGLNGNEGLSLQETDKACVAGYVSVHRAGDCVVVHHHIAV
jgi:hypothetical protein